MAIIGYSIVFQSLRLEIPETVWKGISDFLCFNFTKDPREEIEKNTKNSQETHVDVLPAWQIRSKSNTK